MINTIEICPEIYAEGLAKCLSEKVDLYTRVYITKYDHCDESEVEIITYILRDILLEYFNTK